MPRIGDWVLRTACAEAAKWPRHIRVAVNLSPVQFADPALAATVTGTLAASRLDPERLELEINEAVFLADRAVTEATLTRLRGARRAPRARQFRHRPFGPRPFARRAARQDQDRPELRPRRRRPRAAATAPSSGRSSSSPRASAWIRPPKGAETIEELALIRRLGCSQVQGFIFARPMPADEALKLATESRPSAEVVGFSRPPRHRLIRNGRLHLGGPDPAGAASQHLRRRSDDRVRRPAPAGHSGRARPRRGGDPPRRGALVPAGPGRPSLRRGIRPRQARPAPAARARPRRCSSRNIWSRARRSAK